MEPATRYLTPQEIARDVLPASRDSVDTFTAGVYEVTEAKSFADRVRTAVAHRTLGQVTL